MTTRLIIPLWIAFFGLLAVLAASIVPAVPVPSGWDAGLLAGAVVLLALFAVFRGMVSQGRTIQIMLWLGLAAGLALRVASWFFMDGVPASLGFDLFSGAAVLDGQNPYAHAPSVILGEGLRVGDKSLQALRELAAASPEFTAWLAAVPNQEQTSETPLLALPFLAFAQQLTPGSVDAWFGVLMMSDLVVLLVLLTLMRQVRRASGWVLLFWLNPIWLALAFAQGSTFILLAPVLTIVVWASVSERSAAVGMMLAIAAGFNLWLGALLPLFLRSAGRRPSAWRRAAYGVVGFLLFGGVIWVLHLIFGAPIHWFASLNGDNAVPGLILAELAGMGLYRTLIWIGLLTVIAFLSAAPGLPDQAQRTVRAGFVGFVMIVLSTSLAPLSPLVLVIFLPLARSPAMVLAAGFGALVAALSPLAPDAFGLTGPVLTRLDIAAIILVLFTITLVASLRRAEPLD